MAEPRSFEQVLRDGINRTLFIQQMEEKAPRRKPAKTLVQPKGTLFAIRNKRISVREGALRRVQIIITYTKETTNETKKYVVAPYSYRYRRLKSGRRKMLFAWDMDDQHIKGFVINNIRNVALTDKKFTPKWRVEIMMAFILPTLSLLFL
jgi:predicted DNA-binding transcriptional regulator YafY